MHDQGGCKTAGERSEQLWQAKRGHQCGRQDYSQENQYKVKRYLPGNHGIP